MKQPVKNSQLCVELYKRNVATSPDHEQCIELESATSYVKQQQLLARPAVLRLLLLLLLLVWLSASVQQQPWQQQFKVGAHCLLHFSASSAAASAAGEAGCASNSCHSLGSGLLASWAAGGDGPCLPVLLLLLLPLYLTERNTPTLNWSECPCWGTTG